MVDAPKKKHVLNVRFLKVRESMEDEYRSKMADNNAGLVRGAPGGFTFMPTYAKHAQDVYNTPLRTDDTWVVTFPKCGSWPFAISLSSIFEPSNEVHCIHRNDVDSGTGVAGGQRCQFRGGQGAAAGEIAVPRVRTDPAILLSTR